MNAWIIRTTAALSTPFGALVLVAVNLAGLVWLTAVGFSEGAMTAYTLFLSIEAIVLSSMILVASQNDTVAMQAKLDEILHAIPKADDGKIGIEKPERT